MNDISKEIVKLMGQINKQSNKNGGENLVAYSIDAGAHVFLFYLK